MERTEQTAESSPFFSEIGGTRDASSSTSAAWSEQQSRAVRVVITVLASATADEADSPAIFLLFLPSLASLPRSPGVVTSAQQTTCMEQSAPPSPSLLLPPPPSRDGGQKALARSLAVQL